jgi:hypothetical protein
MLAASAALLAPCIARLEEWLGNWLSVSGHSEQSVHFGQQAENLVIMANIGATSRDQNPTGYLPVVLPVGSLAREEWVVGRWLEIAVDVEGPRPNRVLA